jgi:hypothetical protein
MLCEMAIKGDAIVPTDVVKQTTHLALSMLRAGVDPRLLSRICHPERKW